MSEQLPPVRVDDQLLDEITEFTQRNGYESTSSAIRHLLRRGLREADISSVTLFLASSSDDLDQLEADTAQTLLESWRDLMEGLSSSEIDLVTLAGGEEEISKKQLAAAYRFQRKEATEDDFQHIVDMIQKPVDLDALAQKLND